MRGLYSLNIYKILPLFLQNTFITIKGMAYSAIRRDRKFYYLQNDILTNEKRRLDEINSLQLAKLKELLTYVYEFVPYYRMLFKSQGIQPSSFQCITDLEKLPLLDKKTVQTRWDEFIATNKKRKLLFKGSTSGSTGTPLSLLMDRNVIRSEHAFVWRQFRWAGCRMNGRIATFRGDMVVSVDQNKPPYWRYDAYNNELWFSSYHLSEATSEAYFQKLQEFEPELIYAYPSSLFILAKFIRQRAIKVLIPSLRGIVTSSETLLEHQKILIRETFNTQVFDWYGLFERVIFIGTCESGSYHVFPDYGVTELIPTSENEEESQYELVGTGFINFAMPLIRYRTGDIVTLTKDPCNCGRAFTRIGSILGRMDDMIVTPNERTIGRLDHVFKDVANIRCSQIVQESLDTISILIVPESQYSASDEKKIINNARLRLGEKMNIDIQLVNDIPREKSGKFKAVISRL